MTSIDELIARLRADFTRIPGTGTRLVNPDGPEAAATLQRLKDALERIDEDGHRGGVEHCRTIAREALQPKEQPR